MYTYNSNCSGRSFRASWGDRAGCLPQWHLKDIVLMQVLAWAFLIQLPMVQAQIRRMNFALVCPRPELLYERFIHFVELSNFVISLTRNSSMLQGSNHLRQNLRYCAPMSRGGIAPTPMLPDQSLPNARNSSLALQPSFPQEKNKVT
jgi:hypothetical protein